MYRIGLNRWKLWLKNDSIFNDCMKSLIYNNTWITKRKLRSNALQSVSISISHTFCLIDCDSHLVNKTEKKFQRITQVSCITILSSTINVPQILITALAKELDWNSFRVNQNYSDSFRYLYPSQCERFRTNPKNILYLPWRKYRIGIHSKPIRTIPIHFDTCIRANANHSKTIRKTFCNSFDEKW